jgi:hypothetical protein
MKTCDECGLPQKVCEALTMYRNAFKSYEEGDLAAAHKSADGAALLIAGYRAEQQRPIKLYQLSDSDRLRLSGLF